jgi:transmembrane protein TMEM260 (protein O-mannosyltransferase)
MRRYLPLFLLIVGVTGFYLTTLAPSLNWADGARMQLDAMFGGSTYWSFDEARQVQTDGLPFDRLGAAAWDHPLYIIIAQAFIALPFAEPLYAINLMSAFFGVLALVVVFAINLDLTDNPWMSALGALALAVSHTFWFHAVTSENYTLHIFFMSLLIWLSLQWMRIQKTGTLLWFMFIAGLGLANHIMLGLTFVPLCVFLVAVTQVSGERQIGLRLLVSPKQYRGFARKLGLRNFLISMGLFVLGLAPWWIQFLRMTRLLGFPLTLRIAFGFPWLGARMHAGSPAELLTHLLQYAGWLLLQFMLIGVVFGIYGFWKMRRSQPAATRLFLTLMAIHILFSANYSLADQFDFHLPSYLFFSFGITWGLVDLWQRIENNPALTTPGWRIGLSALALLVILTPIQLYAMAPALMRSLGYTEERLKIPPIGQNSRDAFDYFLNPNSRGDDSASRFARSTLSQLAPNALVFTPKPSDQETYVVLRYVQLIEAQRPDVHLELMLFDPADDIRQGILQLALSQASCRPEYLASLNPNVYPLEALRDSFEIIPEANLYRILPRKSLQTSHTCPPVDARWAGLPFKEALQRLMRGR